MELRQLRYFVRIVDVGSVSRASQSLHVAQPALSQQISRLEAELGVKLLSRSVRGVAPTEAGAAVYQQAQRILRQVEATPAIAQHADMGPAGPVSVGLPWTVTSVLGLSLLQEVRTQFPGVRLQITEGSSAVLANMLMRGQLDLAVVFDDTTNNGLTLHPILREPLLLVGGPGSFPGKKALSVREAAARPLLLLSRPNSIREAVDRLWSAMDVAPNVVAELNAPRLLVEAVKAGLGYSILPSCGIEDAVQQGQVQAVGLKDAGLTRTVFLGQSKIFPLSRAGEEVHELMEQLVRTAVSEGRWRGQIIAGDGNGKHSAANRSGCKKLQ